MNSNYQPCLRVILREEGGFVDDPQDPGGATNMGITLRELSGYRHAPQTIADVQNLTEQDVAAIYQTDYWNVARCPELPVGIDLMVFDESVNEGPGTAIRHLQAALGVTADGDVGPSTLGAVASANLPNLVSAIVDSRDAYYRSLPGFHHDGAGWLARVKAVAYDAQQMIAQGAPS